MATNNGMAGAVARAAVRSAAADAIRAWLPRLRRLVLESDAAALAAAGFTEADRAALVPALANLPDGGEPDARGRPREPGRRYSRGGAIRGWPFAAAPW
jgi:hypothetical protein